MSTSAEDLLRDDLALPVVTYLVRKGVPVGIDRLVHVMVEAAQAELAEIQADREKQGELLEHGL